MSDEQDPFAGMDTDIAVAPVQEPKVDTIPSGGSVFVYDLETVPDESRFPRPVKVEKAVKPDATVDLIALQQQTVAAIKAKIPVLSLEQLLALSDMEDKSSKPRQGVKDAIWQQRIVDTHDDYETQMMEWRKHSFNPFGCKIVALGIKSSNHRVTMLAKNEDEERELLRVLWLHIQRFKTRCGYNITNFDDAVLIMRSMLLGVDATEKISRKKFGDRASIDLMTVLFPSSGAMKLKELCKQIGIVPPVGYEMSGDKVFDLVEAGDWDGIAAYVSSDADIEFELYQRLADYMVF